jgi:hypothetical protein
LIRILPECLNQSFHLDGISQGGTGAMRFHVGYGIRGKSRLAVSIQNDISLRPDIGAVMEIPFPP